MYQITKSATLNVQRTSAPSTVRFGVSASDSMASTMFDTPQICLWCSDRRDHVCCGCGCWDWAFPLDNSRQSACLFHENTPCGSAFACHSTINCCSASSVMSESSNVSLRMRCVLRSPDIGKANHCCVSCELLGNRDTLTLRCAGMQTSQTHDERHTAFKPNCKALL